MLGEFKLSYGTVSLDVLKYHSKKTMNLLAYVLAFHSKKLSQQELIHLLWPDESSINPAAALKTLLHRTRKQLTALPLPKGLSLIEQKGGEYRWTTKQSISLDFEQFEVLCKLAKIETNPHAKLELYKEAISLYKGDFLSFLDSSWVIPIRAYYHTLYLGAIHEMIELLHNQQDYQTIIKISCDALSIDSYDEDLYYFLIEALYYSGNITLALQQYHTMVRLLYERFSVHPDTRFITLYNNMKRSYNKKEVKQPLIDTRYQSFQVKTGAFFCEYHVFKEIYRLELRSCNRKKEPIFLCMIRLVEDATNDCDDTYDKQAVTIVSDSILYSLRSSDVYARYSLNEFIVLLPNTTTECGTSIVKRIFDCCNKKLASHTYSLDYEILKEQIDL